MSIDPYTHVPEGNPGGAQLSLELDGGMASPRPDPMKLLERRQAGMDLLLELAQALGELRAEVDLEALRSPVRFAARPDAL